MQKSQRATLKSWEWAYGRGPPPPPQDSGLPPEELAVPSITRLTLPPTQYWMFAANYKEQNPETSKACLAIFIPLCVTFSVSLYNIICT